MLIIMVEIVVKFNYMLKTVLRYSGLGFRASFQKFANLAINIEGTASNLEKLKKMQDYFAGCDQQNKESILNIMNFLKDKPKTGISSATIAKILKQKYFKETQDPGNDIDQIVNHLQDGEDKEEGNIELSEVQKILMDLQTIQGKKSANKKIEMINLILDSMTVAEIKIFTRIVSKNLRVGLSAKFYNSFLQKYDKNYSQKKKQGASNNQGSQEKQKMIVNKKKLGNQNQYQSKFQMPNIQLMLAKPLKNMQDFDKFCQNKKQQNLIADLKYDGQRTLIIYKKGEGVELVSRRRKWQTDIYKPFANIVNQELSALPEVQSIKIDGEIMCVSLQKDEHLPMQSLIKKRGKQETEDQSSKVVVYGFDVIEYNGKSLLEQYLINRRQFLPKTKHVLVGEYLKFSYPTEKQKLMNFYKQTLQKKLEGLIIKGQKDLYHTNGTRKHWGKLKRGFKISGEESSQIDLDLVVMGVSKGQGKRKQFFSTFLVGVYHEDKLYPVSKVGTGFSEQQLKQFTQLFSECIVAEKPDDYEIPKTLRMDHYVDPIHVFKISCQNLTRSPLYKLKYEQNIGGISLRFPVFHCLRDDKSPKSCSSDTLLQYLQSEQKNQ